MLFAVSWKTGFGLSFGWEEGFLVHRGGVGLPYTAFLTLSTCLHHSVPPPPPVYEQKSEAESTKLELISS